MTVNAEHKPAIAKKERYMAVLHWIQEPTEHDFTAVKAKLAKQAAEKNPLMTKILSKVDKAGDLSLRVGEQIHNLQVSHATDSVAQGFHIGSIVVAAIDFITIPVTYLVTYLSNQKVPFNLKNNAKWGYAAVILGLVIAAFVAPAVAIYIGLAVAGLVFAVSTFTLGKTIYQRYQLGRENKKLAKELQVEERNMLTIQSLAKQYEQQLDLADSEVEAIKIYQEIAILKERFLNQHKVVADLKNKKFESDQNLKNTSVMKVVDKSVGVGLGAAAIVGLALLIFFPPVGTAILTGVAAAALTYFVARVTMGITQFVKGIRAKKNEEQKQKPEDIEPSLEEDVFPNAEDSNSLSDEPYEDYVRDSTLSVIDELGDLPPEVGKVVVADERRIATEIKAPAPEPSIKAEDEDEESEGKRESAHM